MKRRTLGLRPWSSGDNAGSEWWTETWQALGLASAPRLAAVSQVGLLSARLSSITLDDELAGFAAVAQDPWLIVAIVVQPRLRGWGYGSEAVTLLEQQTAETPSALAATTGGLALYFWLRLGYFPASEQPWRPRALLLTRNKG